MSSAAWVAIEYRDFYDIPRIFVVKYSGRHFLFDCPFNDDLDEYLDEYSVFQLPETFVQADLQGAWNGLAGRGTLIGKLPTRKVRFAPTRRAAINADVLEDLARRS